MTAIYAGKDIQAGARRRRKASGTRSRTNSALRTNGAAYQQFLKLPGSTAQNTVAARGPGSHDLGLAACHASGCRKPGNHRRRRSPGRLLLGRPPHPLAARRAGGPSDLGADDLPARLRDLGRASSTTTSLSPSTPGSGSTTSGRSGTTRSRVHSLGDGGPRLVLRGGRARRSVFVLALAMLRPFRGRRALMMLFVVPLFISPVIVGGVLRTFPAQPFGPTN